MKKLMILGAGIYQEPLIKYATQRADVVLVAPQIKDELADLVYKTYISDVRDRERILEIAKNENIDGIITDQTDIPVRTIAYIAEKLNLPGNDYNVAEIFTDKYKMREKCKEAGIPVLEYVLTETIDEAVEFFRKLGKAVILKPVDNQGSRGIKRIETEDELIKYFEYAKENSAAGTVLVEQYVTGREFVVEGMAYNHNFKNLICGDTVYFESIKSFSANRRVFPSTVDENTYNRILELNEKIVKAFGLKQGITHGEYIMDDDKIYLIEIAARGGGVHISSDLISLKTGLNTEKFLVDIALDEAREMPVIEDKDTVCGYVAFYLPQGIVKSINGTDKLDSIPFVKNHICNSIHIGQEIGSNTDKTTRFSIIIEAQDRGMFEEYRAQLIDLLKIEIETDNGICYPIWE